MFAEAVHSLADVGNQVGKTIEFPKGIKHVKNPMASGLMCACAHSGYEVEMHTRVVLCAR